MFGTHDVTKIRYLSHKYFECLMRLYLDKAVYAISDLYLILYGTLGLELLKEGTARVMRQMPRHS